ncbi:MAG: ATP-binding protein [Bacteroidota bacterium]
MQSKKSHSLLFFYILVAYVLIQFAWWSCLLIKQNNEIYRLKSEINLLHHENPQLVIEKENELEKKLHLRWLMIAGEGMVFIILLAIAFWRVRSTFKKEMELISRQKNFLLSVTHELSSPIASVKLQLETLLKRELDKEKVKEILGNAITDTERLNKLVKNILLAAKIDNSVFELHREKINLSDFFNTEILQIVQSLYPKQEITFHIQPDIFFSIDKTSFFSIILNLLENAVKYSPQNSIIEIILKQEANRIIFSVQDEGTGIPEEEKQNIFKKFYRIGNEEVRMTKGTGLGLYIVKYLVEQHGGKISVKNNFPKGSIFKISFISMV